jgi:hypothetical protein
VADTATKSLKGSATLTVSPAAASTFLLKTPSSVKHGTAFSYTLTARDPYGNTATSYAGTASFSSTAGGNAVLPAPYTFTATDKGVHSFTATFAVKGSFTITATDTVTSTITGTSSTIKSG